VKARIKPQDLGDFSQPTSGVSQKILVPPVEKLAEQDSAYLDVFNRLSLDRNRSCVARSALRLVSILSKSVVFENRMFKLGEGFRAGRLTKGRALRSSKLTAVNFEAK
jgi:hypothetical protein